MKKFILSLITCCVVMPSFAKDDRIVYQFKMKDGSALLTNKPKQEIKNDSTSVKATKYVPAIETIHVPAKDVYKRGWCKIGTSLVPCYNYQNTVAAHSYKEKEVKRCNLHHSKHKIILINIIKSNRRLLNKNQKKKLSL
jgi:hypothetical protein